MISPGVRVGANGANRQCSARRRQPRVFLFQVLDVTDYLSKHPGGKRSILVPPRCKSTDSAEGLNQLEKVELTGVF